MRGGKVSLYPQMLSQVMYNVMCEATSMENSVKSMRLQCSRHLLELF